MQKLLIALIEELDPAMKAKASVIEVMVIEGPECRMASIILSFLDNFKEV